MKTEVTTKMGRPLLYGEQTVVLSGFHCPQSKRKEMEDLIKAKLKTWEIPRETNKTV